MRRFYTHIRFFAFLTTVPLLIWVFTWLYSYVQAQLPFNQNQQIEVAKQFIQSDFRNIQERMLAQAEQVGHNEFIQLCLAQVTSGDRLDHLAPAQKQAVAYFNALKGFDTDNEAVELYDLEYDLLGWHGLALSLNADQKLRPFPQSLTVQILTDPTDGLQALELWKPVLLGRSVVGGIRVLHLINVPASAQRSSLPAFQLNRHWERQTGLFLTIHWQKNDKSTAANRDLHYQNLISLEGKTLGQVSISTLSNNDLVDVRNIKLHAIQVFSLCLVLLWILYGLFLSEQYLFRHYATLTHRAFKLWGSFLFFSVVLGAIRYALADLDIPKIWLENNELTRSLFDPKLFASDFGGGLLRSIGDFFLTSIFLFIFSLRTFIYLRVWISAQLQTDEVPVLSPSLLLSFDQIWQQWKNGQYRISRLRQVFLLGCISFALWLEWVGLDQLIQRVMFDSKLDYLAWTGLFPTLPLIVAYCALLVCAASFLVVALVLIWLALKFAHFQEVQIGTKQLVFGILALLMIVLDGAFALWFFRDGLKFWHSFLFHLVALCFALYLALTPQGTLRVLSLRGLLVSLVTITVFLYPMIFNTNQNQVRQEMQHTAESFVKSDDQKSQEALDQALADTRLSEVLYTTENGSIAIDSTRTQEITNRLQQDLGEVGIGSFEVSIAVLTQAQTTYLFRKGSSIGSDRSTMTQTLFSDLKQLSAQDSLDQHSPTVALGLERFTPLFAPTSLQNSSLNSHVPQNAKPLGWALIRIQQNTWSSQDRRSDVPRSATLQIAEWPQKVSIAEFENGVLYRSEGSNLGQIRLPDFVLEALKDHPNFWEKETIYERTYNTLYQKIDRDRTRTDLFPEGNDNTVLAIRVPANIPYDHLYYLLRMIISGLWLLLPSYGIGLWLRYKAGLLPAPRIEFRDKVLNAFFAVGIVVVMVMGVVGQDVVMRDNQAIQRQLERRLQRVEDALNNAPHAQKQNLLPFQALGQILQHQQLDSLATALSLDLTVYEAANLLTTTRPELVKERLVGTRLPIQGYAQLYLEGFQNAFVNAKNANGNDYMVGYKALTDEKGYPRFIVAVLLLSEQAYLQEERARSIAYLFGALLLLLVMVMGTATFLADTLSRPISRLRDGMKAAAAGQFDERLPVESRDEVGELVQTFNEMQQQLADSRRKLSLQERQMAWNEMARQVAHEIKNPLTPMKLSVQHLQRAYQNLDPQDIEQQERFTALFKRVTSTLTEQTDALTRIANEFSNFARMPQRILEVLDLNKVLQETLALFGEESAIQLKSQLAPSPLWVEADREELRRIFINLLKNGLQAMPDGGILSVKSQYLEEDQDGNGAEKGLPYAHVAVTDTGTGIPEDIQAKIFQPNFSTKTSGMGLGLAIVKKSIEDLHGRILFETELGKGTTFFVWLPIHIVSSKKSAV